MQKEMDFSNLTAEQLAYIRSLEGEIGEKDETISAQREEIRVKDATISEQASEMDAKDKAIASKDAEIRERDEIIKEILKTLNVERSIVKRLNLERFVTKKDIPQPTNSGVKNVVAKSKKKPGRKRGSRNFGEDYLESLSASNPPITLDIATELLKANPGMKLIKIKDEETYLIKQVKAHVTVHRVIIPIYKGDDGRIYRSEHMSPIHHSNVDASLLSDAITMKYFLGVPEYRYEKWLKGEGLPFSQRTLNNWASQCASLLGPFYEHLKLVYAGAESGIRDIHVDETWIDVIENKRENRSKSYIFCYSGRTKHGNKVPFFEFSTTRETNCVANTLAGYEGNITVDGYAGYNSIRSGKVTLQRCMVHARRELANIVKTLRKDQLKDSIAYKGVQIFDRIFLKERQFKTNSLMPDEKLAQRHSAEYQGLVNELNDYFNNMNPEKNSPLAKAKTYWSNLNGEQWTYLDNGHVDLDNNEAERQAKKFVLDRKNFLFCKSEKGAKTACILLTMIDLGYENGLEPRSYIEYLLNNIGKKDFRNLLPWSGSIPPEIRI